MKNTYTITDYSRKQAKRLGVIVKRSKRKGKKLDVINPDSGRVVASIGAIGYKDYPTYLSLERRGLVPKGTAKKKRNQYKARAGRLARKKGSPAFYAMNILW